MTDRMHASGKRDPDLMPGPAAPISCLEAKEWMPWFVTGKLGSDQDALLTAHLSHCPGCQRELVELLGLQKAVASEIAGRTSAGNESWKRVRSVAFASDVTEIDIGTLLLGFQLGIRATHGRSSVDGSIRILGRRLRVLGHSSTRASATGNRATPRVSKPRDGHDSAESGASLHGVESGSSLHGAESASSLHSAQKEENDV